MDAHDVKLKHIADLEAEVAQLKREVKLLRLGVAWR